MMEIVIKIPEDSYKATCVGCMLPSDVENVVQAIKNGTPLPKHHGRLIDADKLYNDYVQEPEEFKGGRSLMNLFREAPTIIEAGGGGEDEEEHDS